MSVDRNALRREAGACLGANAPVGELSGCIAKNFPDVETYRENDDLIVKRGARFLMVRRFGADHFRAVESASGSPTTNLLDQGGGDVRTLDELLDAITKLAEG